MCLVARAGPCDAESASTQEDDYAALCWQALIQLMRERATSCDAILPVLREKRVERRHCTRPSEGAGAAGTACRLTLLRARRERPRGCSAAEKRDELASP